MAAPHSNGSVRKRLAIVAPSGWSLTHLRDDFMRAVAARGHEVHCLCAELSENDKAELAALGAKADAIDFDLPGMKFFADRKILGNVQKAFADWRPDAVLGFGGRPMVFAALAARRAGVGRVVSMVNGLPEFGLKAGSGGDQAVARHFARALKVSDAIVFHNKDDPDSLKRDGILPAGVPHAVVPGAGIDVERCRTLPLPPLDDGLVFLKIARLERPRGVGEFAFAAREVKSRAPNARFVLAGPQGAGLAAISPDALGADGDALSYIGEVRDVRAELAKAHVFVYASRAEGMPRAIQEALAAGRPVIAADVAGCRETVDERVNGCLFEPGNARSLADAIESFLKRPDLIPSMARASRVKAERRFDVRAVNAALLNALALD